MTAVVGPDDRGDHRLGRRPGDLAGLLAGAGATDVEETRLGCSASYSDLDDWWSSFTGGAGPVGAYLQSPDEDRARVRKECDRLLGHPRAPFTLEASGWCGIGSVPA